MRYTVWHFGSLWNGPDRFHVIWNILTTISQYSLYKASVSANIFWFVNCLYRCWESQNPKLHWSAASVLGTFCCVYCHWWVEERGCELMAKTAEIVKSLLCIEISGIKSNLVFVCFFLRLWNCTQFYQTQDTILGYRKLYSLYRYTVWTQSLWRVDLYE